MSVLYFLHNRDKKNNRRQENVNFSNRHYHIEYIKYLQYKNFNMTSDYQKFPRHPISAEKIEMREINNIILHYRYRLDPKHGNCVCEICRIQFLCPYYVYQLDQYWLPSCDPSSQSMYFRV